jgi:hypothetical protein
MRREKAMAMPVRRYRCLALVSLLRLVRWYR